MVEFVRQNPLLVLGIAGASISFLISLLEFISERKTPRRIFLLVILGFLILIGQQAVEFVQERNAEAIAKTEKALLAANEETRTKIIEQIQSNVQVTRVTVESIAVRLQAVPLSSLGNELVTIANTELREAETFAKGAPEAWPAYADWIQQEVEGGREASLTLTLNAHGSYDVGLLLAYLLTASATRADIAGVVRSPSDWDKFPSPEFLTRHGTNVQGAKWVLFFDGNPSTLVAFADATSFAHELTILAQRAADRREIERLLNDPTARPAAEALAAKFASVRTDILHESQADQVVSKMIEEQIAIAAVVPDGGPRYMVRLERMIKVATQTN